MYEFDIEFIILGTMKSLIVIEAGKTKCKTDAWASLDGDFNDMIYTLKKRINKVLAVKYMHRDGYIKE